MPTFDFSDLTDESESDPRRGDFDTLQWHHSVTTTYEAARELMDPGGRTVSANGLMTADGRLGLVVDLPRRAFTSASSFDHRSLTVECVNTSGGPEYGLSDATHRRLGQTLAEMVREGRSQIIYGPGGLIQHKDVPGSYATACAGPSADSDRVLAYASQYLSKPRSRRNTMTTNYAKISSSPDGQGGKDSLWATAGDLGTPCPGNWDEFKRTVYDNTNPLDRGARAAAIHGVPILLSDKEWEAKKALYTTPVPVGSVTTKPDPALLAAVEANTAVLKELLTATKKLNPPD